MPTPPLSSILSNFSSWLIAAPPRRRHRHQLPRLPPNLSHTRQTEIANEIPVAERPSTTSISLFLAGYGITSARPHHGIAFGTRAPATRADDRVVPSANFAMGAPHCRGLASSVMLGFGRRWRFSGSAKAVSNGFPEGTILRLRHLQHRFRRRRRHRPALLAAISKMGNWRGPSSSPARSLRLGRRLVDSL